MIFSEVISFVVALSLIIGVGYLIYRLGDRAKNQGRLFTKRASSSARIFALLIGILLDGFVLLDWISGLRVYWPLLFIGIPLVMYGLGLKKPLMTIQSWKIPTIQMSHHPLVKNSLRFIAMFPIAMIIAAFGGLLGALLGMLVGLVAGWDIFLLAGIGSILIGVGFLVEFVVRIDLHSAYGIIYGGVSGLILGTFVALSYGDIWVIVGFIIGILGSSIGIVLQKQNSINHS